MPPRDWPVPSCGSSCAVDRYTPIGPGAPDGNRRSDHPSPLASQTARAFWARRMIALGIDDDHRFTPKDCLGNQHIEQARLADARTADDQGVTDEIGQLRKTDPFQLPVHAPSRRPHGCCATRPMVRTTPIDIRVWSLVASMSDQGKPRPSQYCLIARLRLIPSAHPGR